MYRLEIKFKNHTILVLTATYNELKTFLNTITECGAEFELIKNQKVIFFDTLEELRLFFKEVN